MEQEQCYALDPALFLSTERIWGDFDKAMTFYHPSEGERQCPVGISLGPSPIPFLS